MEPTALKVLIDRAPEITPAPFYAPPQRRGLIDRQLEPETCGYWSADANDPYTCSVGYACAENNRFPIFGCCVTDMAGDIVSGSCAPVENPYTSCVEYVSAEFCTGDCWSSNRVCDSTNRFCAVGYSITDSSTYSNWFCQSLAGGTPSLFIFAEATNESTPTPTSTPRTSIRDPTSSSTTGPTSPGPTTTPSDPAPRPTDDDSSDDSGASKGAIAGGVVGGLAGLALIVTGAIFFLRRAKKQERKQAFAEVSQI